MTASLLAFVVTIVVAVGLAVWVVVWTEWSDRVQLVVAAVIVVIGIIAGALLFIALIPWPASD